MPFHLSFADRQPKGGLGTYLKQVSRSKQTICLFTGALLLALLLGGCQPGSTEPPPQPTDVAEALEPQTQVQSPLAAPVSPLPPPPGLAIDAGKSAVYGRLLSSASGQPIAGAIVRLAEVYCPEDLELKTQEEKEENCFWALDDAFSPSTYSEANGDIVFTNTEARDYAILVGDIGTRYELVKDKAGKVIVYSTIADEPLDVGVHSVPYP